jgi:hypothetical protein
MPINGEEQAAPLPKGIVFGQMACHPSHGGGGRTKGEDRLLDSLGAGSALRAARVGRVIDTILGRIIHPGRPLNAAEIELLRLCEYGIERPKAKEHKNGTLTLAVEALKVRDALPLLRAPGHPRTEKEARQMLQRARKAYEEALQERGMIPAMRPGPARASKAARAPEAAAIPTALPRYA